MENLAHEQVEIDMAHIFAAPRDRGRLETIVIRPRPDERVERQSVFLSPAAGVEGDYWQTSSWLRLPDGGPDPRVQVSLINARLLRTIAVREERICLAGDNLIVDLDLSEENLPVGQKLAIGEAVIEISDVAHTGCKKLAARYGRDATNFVNAIARRSLHLRGLYARVLRAGRTKVGDL